MSQKLQPVRGTQDLLPETAEAFRAIDNLAYRAAHRYGYNEIQTPIFEFSDVFHRTLGETSDMVAKETYTFLDRGGESITLRPEGTAGIARAFISNGLAQNLPLKFYYSGPMFRYERPQKGRYRQFHQLGVECLGFTDAESDVECISLGYQILTELGLQNKINLEINTLGDETSRTKHRDLLVSYLSKYEKDLSPDSQIRLQKNPLRILDSKDANDKKIIAEAPSLKSCLNDDSKKFFDQVLHGLTILGIQHRVSENLVRGIDYYTHTVFEFTTEHLGAQSAVLAGGRYNGLIKLMGGQDTPGVGWASGIERLALLLGTELKQQKSTIAVIAADESSQDYCLKLTYQLRAENKTAEYIRSGNMGKKMAKAAKLGCTKAIIIGPSEIQSGNLTIKNLATGEQTTITEHEIKNI